MLHVGNMDIATFIKKFPDTEHDLESLKLDTCFFMVRKQIQGWNGTMKLG